MPALPNTDHVIEMKLYGPAQGGKWLNRQHIQYSGGRPTTTDLTTLANTLKTAWGTQFAALHPAGNNLTNIILTDLTDKSGATATSTGAAIVGTRVGVALPVNCAITISWPINRRFRGGHCRSYLPALVAADVISGNQIAGSMQTTLQAAAAGWRSTINGATLTGGACTMVAVSYYLGTDQATGKPVLRPVPQVDPINVPIVHARMDSQRRRLGKEF